MHYIRKHCSYQQLMSAGCRGCFEDFRTPQVLANDLLESVRKTESSLKKLKKNRTAGGGGGATEGAASGASDADKMTTQLFLDVQVRCVRLFSPRTMKPAPS